MNKKKNLFMVILLLAGVSFLFSSLIRLETARELFERALYLEETKGDLEKAIDVYSRVVKEFPDERATAAKAQLHIGLCYEKLGLKEAQNAFQKVVDSYPEQAEAVKTAKEKLDILLRAKAVFEKGDKEFKITKIHTEKISREGHLSPDGKKLALIDYLEYKLLLRDIASGKEVCLFSSPNQIWDCVWSPDSKMIAYMNGNVSVVSAEGGQPRTIIEVDPEVLKAGDYVYPMGWTSDSKKLIFQDTAKGLFAIPASGGKWEEIFRFLDPKKAKERDEWLTLSPDGKFIAYESTQGGNKDVYVMPVQGGESVRITDDPARDSWPAWSYDGQWLAFDSARTGRSETWVIRITPDGKPEGQLIQATRGGGGGVWTQDGKIAYSIRKEIAHIFTANIDGSGEIQLTKFNNWNVRPRWSPDAKNIAFVSDYPGEGIDGIWIVPSKRGDEKFLTPGDSPAWSPDGKKIAFRVDLGFHSGKAKISIIPVEGGESIELMNYDGSLTNLDWSPDGRYVAFSYSRGKDVKNPIPDSPIDIGDIYIISLNGGEPRRLTRMDKKGFQFTSPRWSPDGKKIAFRSFDYEGWEKGHESEPIGIYTIDVQEEESKLVTNEFNNWWFNRWFCWSVDSKNIISCKQEKESTGPWIADQRLYKVSAEGGKPEKLNIMGMMPDLSPDGKKIVFSRITESSIEFWLVENFLPEEKSRKN